jgi:hypothetical protein
MKVTTKRSALALTALSFVISGCTDVQERDSSAPTPRGTVSPTPQAETALEFVLTDEYKIGTRVAVKLRNNSNRSYIYNTAYEACDMRYFDASGRRFIIPPGTHCDIIAPDEIGPDETVTLFKWKLDECLKDQWGCSKSESLPEGSYTIRGWFPEAKEGNRVIKAKGGNRVMVEATFRVEA